MKSCIWTIAFFFLTALSFNAYGDTKTPIMITTDAFTGTFMIDVIQGSNGAVTEMQYQTPTNPNGVLTLAQLSAGPQVIYSNQGYDAILLSLESDFNPTKGGHAIVRYLESGIDSTYKDFRVMVEVGSKITLLSDPDPTDADSDDNSYTGVFNQIYMEKNTFLGSVIGIEDVVPSENTALQ